MFSSLILCNTPVFITAAESSARRRHTAEHSSTAAGVHPFSSVTLKRLLAPSVVVIIRAQTRPECIQMIDDVLTSCLPVAAMAESTAAAGRLGGGGGASAAARDAAAAAAGAAAGEAAAVDASGECVRGLVGAGCTHGLLRVDGVQNIVPGDAGEGGGVEPFQEWVKIKWAAGLFGGTGGLHTFRGVELEELQFGNA